MQVCMLVKEKRKREIVHTTELSQRTRIHIEITPVPITRAVNQFFLLSVFNSLARSLFICSNLRTKYWSVPDNLVNSLDMFTFSIRLSPAMLEYVRYVRLKIGTIFLNFTLVFFYLIKIVILLFNSILSIKVPLH